MLEEEIKLFISQLNFIPENGKDGIFYKSYKLHNYYRISVDFINKKILYIDETKKETERIKLGDTTTCNFSKDENFVVLECIDRLLTKGYSPASIYLEYKWPLGKKQKGKLDILLYKDDKAFLMIECKTWGDEFEKEKKLMLKNGGQLFSYYNQEKSVKYLILYTVKNEGKSIKFKNLIIKTDEKWKELNNVQEIYEHWNKNFYDNGLFEEKNNIYDIQTKKLTLKSLKDLTAEDSGIIFNQFAEILRHNVVSDKPNAFNKILNMFICKIIDEDRNENEELKFQIFENDTSKTLQLRLNDLYKEGMDKFLNIKVSDHDDDEINRLLNLKGKENAKLREIYENLRLKKNPEFAFKEIYDDETFEENAIIVKEIVELLQPYKFRYNHKHQFLGNFFELLLNTSIKQEAGQFFTPVPIAKYIVRSIPIYEMIEEKLKANDIYFLPYAIDYAVGSGHFLTEYMDEVQALVNKITNDMEKYKIGSTLKHTISSYISNPFSWAKEYVYGIDADYRLTKTAKVASFLNGDGDANIIRGNGLDNFKKSKDYIGILKSTTDKKDNQKFDILIANPPYSVNSFKSTVKYGKESFELFENLTDNSSEIECLFIERAKQLLKIGGVAGIILPSTLLTNGGIHSKAREIIFKYFDIIAITELGNNTFMATGTNTVILFLRRKESFYYEETKELVDEFFTVMQDMTINKIEKSISKYIDYVWETISFEDYISLIKKDPNVKVIQHEIFKSYEKIDLKTNEDLLEKVLKIEKEKLLYFLLSYPQNIVLIKTGEKSEEKKFLGYEFSSRRGNEGIHAIMENKSIDECTKLYDSTTFENPEKASTYVYQAFKNNYNLEISDLLKNNITRTMLIDMLTFDRNEFDKTLLLSTKKKIKLKSKWELIKIRKIASTQYGYTAKSKDEGKIRYLRITDINEDGSIKNENEKFIDCSKEIIDQFSLNDNDIVVARSGSVGKTAFYESSKYKKMVFASYLIRLKVDESKIFSKYLFYLTKTEEYWDNQVEVNSIVLAQPNLNAEKIKEFLIPYPPKEIQKKIIEEIEEIEIEEMKYKNKLNILEEELEKNIKEIKGKKEKIGNILTLEYGTSLVEKTRIEGEFPVMGSNGIVGYHNQWLIQGPAIIIGRKGSVGKVTWIDKNCYPIDTTFYVKLINKEISLELLYYLLKEAKLDNLKNGLGVPGLNRNDVYEQIVEIPTKLEKEKVLFKLRKIEYEKNNLKEEIEKLKEIKMSILRKYL